MTAPGLLPPFERDGSTAVGVRPDPECSPHATAMPTTVTRANATENRLRDIITTLHGDAPDAVFAARTERLAGTAIRRSRPAPQTKERSSEPGDRAVTPSGAQQPPGQDANGR